MHLFTQLPQCGDPFNSRLSAVYLSSWPYPWGVQKVVFYTVGIALPWLCCDSFGRFHCLHHTEFQHSLPRYLPGFYKLDVLVWHLCVGWTLLLPTLIPNCCAKFASIFYVHKLNVFIWHLCVGWRLLSGLILWGGFSFTAFCKGVHLNFFSCLCAVYTTFMCIPSDPIISHFPFFIAGT